MWEKKILLHTALQMHSPGLPRLFRPWRSVPSGAVFDSSAPVSGYLSCERRQVVDGGRAGGGGDDGTAAVIGYVLEIPGEGLPSDDPQAENLIEIDKSEKRGRPVGPHLPSNLRLGGFLAEHELCAPLYVRSYRTSRLFVTPIQ